MPDDQPAGVAPTVAKDIASDAAGEPRSSAPALTPPGTETTTFWQSPAVLVAIAGWIVFALFVARPYLISLVGEAAEVLFEAAVWSTTAVFGVRKAGTDAATLRWK